MGQGEAPRRGTTAKVPAGTGVNPGSLRITQSVRLGAINAIPTAGRMLTGPQGAMNMYATAPYAWCRITAALVLFAFTSLAGAWELVDNNMAVQRADNGSGIIVLGCREDKSLKGVVFPSIPLGFPTEARPDASVRYKVDGSPSQQERWFIADDGNSVVAATPLRLAADLRRGRHVAFFVESLTGEIHRLGFSLAGSAGPIMSILRNCGYADLADTVPGVRSEVLRELQGWDSTDVLAYRIAFSMLDRLTFYDSTRLDGDLARTAQKTVDEYLEGCRAGTLPSQAIRCDQLRSTSKGVPITATVATAVGDLLPSDSEMRHRFLE